MTKIHRFMEGFWLLLAIISLIAVTILIFKDGFYHSAQYLVFPLLAGAMYAFRIAFRKYQEKKEREGRL
jgi:uncharacterized membrane protein